MKNILVIGAFGQIGSELTLSLRKDFGDNHVIASDINPRKDSPLAAGPIVTLDARNREAIAEICKKFNIDTIINLAAILSANGEKNPMLAWDININALINTFEIAKDLKLDRVLVPSSIAAFGPTTPRVKTPQETILEPTTMYGITKVTGELLGNYYVNKYGVDIRGLRYPGIISHETLPGGGTTDYAVAIFYEAVKNNKYNCFLKAETRLPMMYMPDCIKATTDLLKADFSKLKHHTNFNVASMDFTAAELAACIKKYQPGFTITYEPDFRQAIADSWPESIDDSAARSEWGWKPAYDMDSMTQDMLKHIKIKHEKGLI